MGQQPRTTEERAPGRAVYEYCPACQRAWRETTTKSCSHSQPCKHQGDSIAFPGVRLVRDFVTAEEEAGIIETIDSVPWVHSQSGRRKQDYGPKVNFKKRKVKTEVFTGLPPFSKHIVDKLKSIDLLRDFETVELCNLDYNPERGSGIDAHKDDEWLWGDRLVTLNLLTGIRYTMTLDDVTKCGRDVCVGASANVVDGLDVVCAPNQNGCGEIVNRSDGDSTTFIEQYSDLKAAGYSHETASCKGKNNNAENTVYVCDSRTCQLQNGELNGLENGTGHGCESRLSQGTGVLISGKVSKHVEEITVFGTESDCRKQSAGALINNDTPGVKNNSGCKSAIPNSASMTITNHEHSSGNRCTPAIMNNQGYDMAAKHQKHTDTPKSNAKLQHTIKQPCLDSNSKTPESNSTSPCQWRNLEVQISIPRRALIVLHGPARTAWKHGIQSHHVTERRVGITMRELTPLFLQGGKREGVGREVLEKARVFEGISVGEFEQRRK